MIQRNTVTTLCNMFSGLRHAIHYDDTALLDNNLSIQSDVGITEIAADRFQPLFAKFIS